MKIRKKKIRPSNEDERKSTLARQKALEKRLERLKNVQA